MNIWTTGVFFTFCSWIWALTTRYSADGGFWLATSSSVSLSQLRRGSRASWNFPQCNRASCSWAILSATWKQRPSGASPGFSHGEGRTLWGVPSCWASSSAGWWSPGRAPAPGCPCAWRRSGSDPDPRRWCAAAWAGCCPPAAAPPPDRRQKVWFNPFRGGNISHFQGLNAEIQQTFLLVYCIYSLKFDPFTDLELSR